MTLIRTDEIRAALIGLLSDNETIQAYLSDPDEVRDYEWKGTDFSYPNIRVQIRENTLDANKACGQTVFASVYIFSEKSSSTEAETIAGVIADEWHTKGLGSKGIFFTQIVCGIIPAIAQDERTWRSEVQVRSSVVRMG